MSSSCGNPSANHDGLMPRARKSNKGKDCVKCKVKPGKIVIRHALYCKECFTPLVTLKFRRALEPSVNAHPGTSSRLKLKAPGALILGFSGGLGSSILLDMVHRIYFSNFELSLNGERGSINHPRSGKVWTTCAVCYVEVCNAFPKARDRTQEITTAVASYPKFDFIPLRLEYAFDESWWRTVTATDRDRSQLAVELGRDGLHTEALRHIQSHDVPPLDALRTYLESLPTQTAVSSAVRILVRLLLLYTAQSHRASHLLLGTSLTTLSVSLVSCISQGGGHSIFDEVQEEWHSGMPATRENIDAIRVVRPLRDVTMKECSMFAWWNSVHVVGRDKQTRATAGIPGITKDFIVGLDKDYPSTVSTIVRTCAKLEPKNASAGLCILCQRAIQEGLDDWKCQIAIRSYTDLKLVPDLLHLPVPPASDNILATSNEQLSILTHLCYACRTMLTGRGTRTPRRTTSSVTLRGQSPSPLSTPLPVWVSTGHVEHSAQDKQLMGSRNGEVWVRVPEDDASQRSKIADFLLDA